MKFITIAFASSLFILSSCVDNDYDLDEKIDLTIAVGGEEFAIPGGKTEAIKLSKILEVKEGDLVKINEQTGDYYLLQTGSPSNTPINVGGFSIGKPKIESIVEDIRFSIPTQANAKMSRADEEYVAELPKSFNAKFKLTAELPDEIIDISTIDLDVNASITIGFKSHTLKRISLKDVTLTFPDYLKSTELIDNKKRIQGTAISKKKPFELTIPINQIDLTKGDYITIDQTGKRHLEMDGIISFNGILSATKADLAITGSNDLAIQLQADINLESKTGANIDISQITGKVDPTIDIKTSPITLSKLPDFLSDEEVRLDVTRPMIFFSVNNNTPVEATIGGTLNSYYRSPSSASAHIAVDFNIPTIAPSKSGRPQVYCMLPSKDNSLSKDTIQIEIPNLPSLVNRIPDEIQIQIDKSRTHATDNLVTVKLGQSYSIETNYSVKIPFAFGDKLTIVYKDTIDGWQKDLEDYKIKQVNLTADVINKIPLNLNFTATPITTNAQGETVELKGITVTIKVNGRADGIITAGDLNHGSESSVVIELRETIPGKVKLLNGLTLKAIANSEGVKNGYLNEKQTIQLINVKLKVPGGIKLDLN